MNLFFLYFIIFINSINNSRQWNYTIQIYESLSVSYYGWCYSKTTVDASSAVDQSKYLRNNVKSPTYLELMSIPIIFEIYSICSCVQVLYRIPNWYALQTLHRLYRNLVKVGSFTLILALVSRQQFFRVKLMCCFLFALTPF